MKAAATSTTSRTVGRYGPEGPKKSEPYSARPPAPPHQEGSCAINIVVLNSENTRTRDPGNTKCHFLTLTPLFSGLTMPSSSSVLAAFCPL